MIISKGRAYVFVHIPKTGGTSLALALENRAMKEDILIGDTPKARRRRHRLRTLTPRGRLWKHSTLADIDGVIGPEDLSHMFVFTLVRNPWDRMVSYYHWLRAQSFDHPDAGASRRLSFDGFVLDPEVQARLAAHPARRYMYDAAGVERCQSYIRLERFEDDAEALFEHLGFRITLPHENRSDRRQDFRSYYSADTRNAVARLFEQDIAEFGYSFDD